MKYPVRLNQHMVKYLDLLLRQIFQIEGDDLLIERFIVGHLYKRHIAHFTFPDKWTMRLLPHEGMALERCIRALPTPTDPYHHALYRQIYELIAKPLTDITWKATRKQVLTA